ncbi:gp19 [Streptococcus pneumoniae]|nr:gp19 [Streptococcus pneumoniae]
MLGMSEIKWIKITTDIFDDEKICLIDALPDPDAILVIWFKILTLAGKHNSNGLLMMTDKVHYTDEMLATIFRRPLNTVRMAIGVFEQFGMIEIIDGIISLPNWEKHQNVDGMEKLQEQRKEEERREEQEFASMIIQGYNHAYERGREAERQEIRKNIRRPFKGFTYDNEPPQGLRPEPLALPEPKQSAIRLL